MKHFDVFYGMNTEDFQNLQTITELMYTAKTLYRNVSELQTEQKTILNDIEIDMPETT